MAIETTLSEIEEGLQEQGTDTPPVPPEGIETPETPSQEAPPEDVSEEVMPEADDRGVSARNVLSEIRRKQDALGEENKRLRDEIMQLRNQQPPPAVAQQPVKISEAEAIQQIQTEIDQAVTEGKITTQGQVSAYTVRRMRELMPPPDINQAIQAQVQSLSKRGASEQQAISEFPDLKDYNSTLSQAVLREVTARESRNPNYRDENPYYLQEIASRLALQMNIRPKSWNGSNQVRQKMQPPLADPGLRSHTQQPEVITPSESDKMLSTHFKTDPKEIAKQRKEQANQNVFLFPEV